MVVYAPGTLESDPKKQNYALQDHASKIKTNMADTAANTADIATNTADIATNTADIAALNASIAGKVTGPSSATDNALARYDGTTGKLVQNSEVTLGDTDGKLSRTAGISVSGTNTNDSAASGYVGEFSSATSGAVGLTSATNTNITSIALTAGDWDITAGFIASGGGTTNMTDLWVSINTVTATNVFTQGQSYRERGYTQVDPANAGNIGPLRVSLSGTTTYYLNAQSTFTGTAVSVTGIIRARRVR